MKKIYAVVLTVLTFGLFLGFNNSDNPKNKMSHDYSGPPIKGETYQPISNPAETDAAIYYSDNFDSSNDTTGLKARGYLVYYRGTGPQGVAATWFQGNTTVFSAFNGAANSYAAANYQVVTAVNDIDSWLVLPDLTVVTGDVMRFRCRGPLGSTFPDSVTVSYNASGGTTPESAGWVDLGKFDASIDGVWELKSFIAPSPGFAARFAIRYKVVDGGPFGDNSDYIGIDALEVEGDGVLPVELSSFVSAVSNNNVTLNWSTATETNNSGFDVERSSVNGQWSKVGNVTGNGTSTVGHSYSFTDRNLSTGNYSYRLKQIDFNGNFEYFNLSNEVNVGVPANFELSQNYPNPFNPTTKIEYQLPNDGSVNISVFDNAGKEVASLVNEFKSAGYYSVNFNAASLSSGVYFYYIKTGDFSAVKKMVLVK
ncbi:MAG: T9SS type A sorting domain-containing protein [Ignavibacteria bacterium]|nr:T9SS type A sorting domain-containing protein [Ignavibacteria bacterium]